MLQDLRSQTMNLDLLPFALLPLQEPCSCPSIVISCGIPSRSEAPVLTWENMLCREHADLAACRLCSRLLAQTPAAHPPEEHPRLGATPLTSTQQRTCRERAPSETGPAMCQVTQRRSTTEYNSKTNTLILSCSSRTPPCLIPSTGSYETVQQMHGSQITSTHRGLTVFNGCINFLAVLRALMGLETLPPCSLLFPLRI